MKQRLDQTLVAQHLARTRSQAEDLINRGFVSVNGKIVTKSGTQIDSTTQLKVTPHTSFVSRAGEKLYSVVATFDLDFSQKIILDVGSSTGGFTDLALRKGAAKVVAVDVGTDQLHISLHGNPRIELHEKTDIRNFQTAEQFDIIVIDVSFISLREILPAVIRLSSSATTIVAMVKPQFEAGSDGLKHKGVIKNDHLRRDIFKKFETWAQQYFIIEAKADSKVSGAKGNVERFYKLRKTLV
ncbi:MAG TPA: TlyA family RNA methyltransferase [Candidatus Saccharimonadales bacterium]|nr:TlyA family RNA methyltransferase [Candidatus Saccharimonadales bacterium]